MSKRQINTILTDVKKLRAERVAIIDEIDKCVSEFAAPARLLTFYDTELVVLVERVYSSFDAALAASKELTKPHANKYHTGISRISFGLAKKILVEGVDANGKPASVDDMSPLLVETRLSLLRHDQDCDTEQRLFTPELVWGLIEPLKRLVEARPEYSYVIYEELVCYPTEKDKNEDILEIITKILK